MTRKALVFVLLTAFFGVVCAAGLLVAADVPDEVIIKDPAFGKFKKGPVKLAHIKHNKEYGVKCKDCHHVYEGGKNTWKEGDPVQKCSECHDPKKKQGKAAKLKNAFHKNCKSCHQQAGKGPAKKCAECHEQA